MKIKLLLSVLIFSTLFLKAQSNRELADKYLDEKGELFFSFNAQNKNQILEFSKVITFDHRKPDLNTFKVYAYANRKQFNEFLKFGIPFKVKKEENGLLLEELLKHNLVAKTTAWDMTSNTYPKYSEYTTIMHDFATNYPSLCSLQSIGTTQNGRELWVLKISDNVNTNEAEPEFLYTSSMHGNELVGFPLMIGLINHLLTNYGTVQEVTDIINSTEIYINPLANPDGAYDGGSNSDLIQSPTRANASGQDLNRNYPDNQNIGRINGGAGLTSRLHVNSTGGVYEKETLAFMKFEEVKNIVLSANFHGGVEVMNYPYDNTEDKHSDHDFYEHISVEYATNAQNDSPAGYMTVDYDNPENPASPGVTQGSIWYVVYGGRQDYMNYFRHSKEVTVELSDEKYRTSILNLPDHWTYNKQALLDYIKQANYGFQGVVSDESGNPIAAKISISGHDALNSWVTSNKDFGDYYRLIKGGTYNVSFEAPGYVTQTINVSITDNTKTIQNVIMTAVTPKPTSSDADLCDLGSASLIATGSGTLNWYNTIDGNSPAFVGANYDTPILNTTTSYFVEDVITNANVGETANSTGGGFLGGPRYLVFDCAESVNLERVTINANQAGELEVQLQDSSGSMLDSRVIILDNAGVQAIDLNFVIPIGTDLRLTAVELSSGLNLYRTQPAGTGFPYNNGSITITDGSAANYYYYFYDWELSNYKSARKEVKVNVNPSPSSNFTHVVNPSNNGEVTFTNDSSNATSYAWDFGDTVGASTDESPMYTFGSTGTFSVKLISTNAECGTDEIIIQVSVDNTLGIQDEILSTFQLYPNPVTSGEIKLKIPKEITAFNVGISNVLGQKVYESSLNDNYETSYTINTSNLRSGIYFVTVSTNLGKATKKLIIQE